jgi:hypothetical protein
MNMMEAKRILSIVSEKRDGDYLVLGIGMRKICP